MTATAASPVIPAPQRQALIDQLGAILPAPALLTTGEALKPYECDGLSAYRALPAMAVLPQTVDEVQRILRVASASATKVVARGSGTGLSGGATPSMMTERTPSGAVRMTSRASFVPYEIP